MVMAFFEKIDKTYADARALAATYKNKELKFTDEEWIVEEEKALALRDPFFQDLADLKKQLMDIEIQLYESVEEANSEFEHIIQDLTNEFIELVQAQFVMLRDAETNFNEVLTETVQRHATLMLSTHPDGSTLPKLLHEFLIDKDFIGILALGTRDLHMQRIDAREDRLITRSRTWVKELNEKLQK